MKYCLPAFIEINVSYKLQCFAKNRWGRQMGEKIWRNSCGVQKRSVAVHNTHTHTHTGKESVYFMQNCQNQAAPAQVQPHSVCWSFNKIRPKYDLMSDAVWHKAPSVLATLAQVSEGYCLKKHQPCLSHVRFTSPSRFIICILDIKKKKQTKNYRHYNQGHWLLLIFSITNYIYIWNYIQLNHFKEIAYKIR